MKVELVNKTVGVNSYSKLNNEEIIAAVARHGKIKEDGGKLVKYLMDNSHWSPLQHIFFSFKVETSRAISAQIFRHKSLNFQETSQRYDKIVDFQEVELRREHKTNRQSSEEVFDPYIEIDRSLGGYIPGADAAATDLIKSTLEDVKYLYEKLLEEGVAKEVARMILPMCSKTTIHISGTFRDILAFLNVRLDHHSQKEVRLIAELMGEALEKELPNIFNSLDWRNGMFM